ncbi:MAG: pyridoxamine kinase [Lactimicrobium sp.]|jgi:pyridoxine kinase|uniref:pyridoxamine kinase n=1 Tax=Lactimicrobium sp. TaxID=2563780 RepID=UPI002F35BACF
MKKILTMQDLSCVGKCSLTVALPVISAMGIECAVLPTAVLSTHTAFSHFTFLDLTSELEKIMHVWKQEHFTFDAIYTGYLGSLDQIAIARELFDQFGKERLRLVDPCMADEGKLYPGFGGGFVKAMKSLCAKADVIVPNVSEACFLLDLPYDPAPSEAQLEQMCRQLCKDGPETVIITGVSQSKGQLGACAYSRKEDRFFFVTAQEQPAHFHGTGDLFASVLAAGLTRGMDMEKALQLACEFISRSIAATLKESSHNDYGVNFEQVLPWLCEQCREVGK